MAKTSRGELLREEIKHDVKRRREMHCSDTVLGLAG